MRIFNYKQVIIVRADLKMSIGKTAVQVAHASISAAEECRRTWPEWYNAWIREGQRKIVVRARDERELRELYEKAKALGLPASIIEDAGLTELEPGTITAVGVGPAPNDRVDRITGSLPLL